MNFVWNLLNIALDLSLLFILWFFSAALHHSLHDRLYHSNSTGLNYHKTDYLFSQQDEASVPATNVILPNFLT